MKAQRIVSALCLSIILLLGTAGEAQAGPRGGGRKGGNVVRSGSATRIGPRGTASGTATTQIQRNRDTRTRNVERQGEVTGPNGRQRTFEGQSQTQRTGENTYDRSWERTNTGPNGESRSWSGEGSGTVERTDNGVTRTYEGTVTTPRGEEHNVTKTAETTRTETGFETDRSRTVTDSAGNLIGTGQSTTTGTRGEGTSTTGTWTGPNGTSTYQGESHRTDEGVHHTWSSTGPAGNSRAGESTWMVNPGEPEPEEEP